MAHPSIRRSVTCSNCGNKFEKPRSHAVGQENHFCDRGCFNEWHTGKNNHSFRSAKTVVHCDYCNSPIEKYQSEIADNNFCNKECMAQYQTKEEYNCSFYNTSVWDSKREEIRERDNNQCRWCGASENLHVHHMKPISSGGDRLNNKNLVTLCQTCHTVAHDALTV